MSPFLTGSLEHEAFVKSYNGSGNTREKSLTQLQSSNQNNQTMDADVLQRFVPTALDGWLLLAGPLYAVQVELLFM